MTFLMVSYPNAFITQHGQRCLVSGNVRAAVSEDDDNGVSGVVGFDQIDFGEVQRLPSVGCLC